MRRGLGEGLGTARTNCHDGHTHPRLVRACTCWQMEPGELTTRLLGEDKDIVQWTAVRAMGQSMYTVMLQVSQGNSIFRNC